MKLTLKVIKHLLLLLLILMGTQDRVRKFSEGGKDAQTYVSAITTFFDGKNPYADTIRSYENTQDVGGHGYAYFPGFLYLFGIFYLVSIKTGINYELAWKIIVLIFDLGVALLLVKHLIKFRYALAVFGLLVWMLNPYIKADFTSYTLVDPVPIFFLLLSLLYLKKDNVLSAVFLTLSILFKPFAITLLPIFFLQSTKKAEFIASCALVFILFSVPFLTSVDNAITYIQGSLLVHSSRVLQGRPLLFYLSYYYKVEIVQMVPLYVYSTIATFFGWVLIVVLKLIAKIQNPFILASVAGLNFLVFTPVLNRTYLLWYLPVFIVGASYVASKFKKSYLYYLPVGGYWAVCYWYLNQWKDGFHVWHP